MKECFVILDLLVDLLSLSLSFFLLVFCFVLFCSVCARVFNSFFE